MGHHLPGGEQRGRLLEPRAALRQHREQHVEAARRGVRVLDHVRDAEQPPAVTVAREAIVDFPRGERCVCCQALHLSADILHPLRPFGARGRGSAPVLVGARDVGYLLVRLREPVQLRACLQDVAHEPAHLRRGTAHDPNVASVRIVVDDEHVAHDLPFRHDGTAEQTRSRIGLTRSRVCQESVPGEPARCPAKGLSPGAAAPKRGRECSHLDQGCERAVAGGEADREPGSRAVEALAQLERLRDAQRGIQPEERRVLIALCLQEPRFSLLAGPVAARRRRRSGRARRLGCRRTGGRDVC
jgi:hypothetical protein